MEAKVFTVENRKGGVAKTTTAVTLACGLTQRLAENGGGRVLLVDLDPQGDAARALGLSPDGRCLSYVLTGESTLRDQVMPADRSADGGPARGASRPVRTDTSRTAVAGAGRDAGARGGQRAPSLRALLCGVHPGGGGRRRIGGRCPLPRLRFGHPARPAAARLGPCADPPALPAPDRSSLRNAHGAHGRHAPGEGVGRLFPVSVENQQGAPRHLVIVL